MLLKKCFEFQKKLSETLGEDLVYSIVYDNGMHILSISAHKSDNKNFSHDRPIQTCIFSDTDLIESSNVVLKKVIELYKMVIVEKGDDDNNLSDDANVIE